MDPDKVIDRGNEDDEGKWELDFQEDHNQHQSSEDDEVKVHALGNIEESSGEEGEIKDGSEDSSEHIHQTPHSSPCQQTTPTVDIISEETAPLVEIDNKNDSENDKKDDDKQDTKHKDETTVSDSCRDTRLTSVCRHFLQGKCSWGKDCRFSHDERALASDYHHSESHTTRLPPNPHGPLRDHRFMPEPFLHPPDYIRPSQPLPPQPPHRPDIPPFYIPYDQEQNVGKVVSQVAEESEGWYRLRTVATHWSSDEDNRSKADLRDNLNEKRLENVSDSENEKIQKSKKKKQRKSKKERSRSHSSEDDRDKTLSNTEKKRLHKQEDDENIILSDDKTTGGGGSMTLGKRKKKKRRHHSSSPPSDDGGVYPPYPYHGPPLHQPPGHPGDRYLPPHRLPEGPFPSPYGPPRIFHGAPGQRHIPMDPYAPPPLPPHDHYLDRYGPPYHGYEWHRPLQSPAPLPHIHRGHRSGHQSPPHYSRRHRDHKNKYHHHSSDSTNSSPDHKQHKKKSKSECGNKEEKSDQTQRKEQLLKELKVINKVIERKKQKKTSSNKNI